MVVLHAYHSICTMHIVVSNLFSSVALLCGVVIILYDCTCAIIARGFCYIRCTYYIHVVFVFVFVPLCFILCWSLKVTHMLLVVMLSPVGQWMFFHKQVSVMSPNDSTHNRCFSLLSRLHGARDLIRPGRHCVTNVLSHWLSFCVYNCNVTFIFWNNFGTLIFPIVRL